MSESNHDRTDLLADRLDDALVALWRGSSEDLDRLLDDGDVGAMVRDAVVATQQPVIGLGTQTRIGGYDIVREIGRGGMGVVYEAAGGGRRVALKVMRCGRHAGVHHARLFQREIETLSRLKHPGIATLYEAGQTGDGLDWFAMELVEGPTLTEHLAGAGGRRPEPMRRRLELLVEICDAVNAAHQRAVIHRDLKPSNIVIDATGRPKVLDFGLARITDADVTTVTSASGPRLMGTLAYMSPEQARGRPDEIDLRCDVYALGVILYELLSDRLPHDLSGATLPEAVRLICETRPEAPGRADRPVPGDVQRIALKALARLPAERYQSAAALGDDVRRFLDGLPILARPPSAWYQLSRLVSRHRLPFAAAGLVVAGIVGFGVWMGVLYARTTDAEQSARSEAAKAREVTAFVQEMIAAADPMLDAAADLTVREVLDAASARLGSELAGQPAVEAAVRHTIGRTYQGLGMYAAAEAHLREALALRRRLGPADDPDVAATMTELGAVLVAMGRYDEAETLHRGALAAWRRAGHDDPAREARMIRHLGECLLGAGRIDQAAALVTEAIGLQRGLPGPDPALAASLKTLARVRQTEADFEAAEAALREADRIETTALGADHPRRVETLEQLADVLQARGDLEGAESTVRAALALSRAALDDTHPRVTAAMSRLVAVLHLRGDFDTAEPVALEVVERRRAETGEGDHPDLAEALSNLGEIRFRLGDHASAAAAFAEALGMLRRSYPGKLHEIAVQVYNLASARRAGGDYDAARHLFAEARDTWTQLHGATHPYVLHARNSIALVLADVGDHRAAEREYREILAMGQERWGPAHPDLQMVRTNLAAALTGLGEHDEAVALCRQSLEAYRAVHGDVHPAIAATLINLGEALRRLGSTDEALVVLDKALAVHAATVGLHHPNVAETLFRKARTLADAGRDAEAQATRDTAIDMAEQTLGADHPRVAAMRAERP